MRRIPMDNFEEWLRAKGLTENTIRQYLYYFAKFTDDLVNQSTVSKFLTQKDNNNTVARSFIKNLKEYLLINYKELGYSKDEALDAQIVQIPKKTGRKPQKFIKVLSIEDIEKIEKHLQYEKHKLMLLVSFYGALRVSELLTLQIKSFQWKEWAKDVQKSCEVIIKGKGSKEAPVFIKSEVAKRVSRYIRSKASAKAGGRYSSGDHYLFVKHNETPSFGRLKSQASMWGRFLRNAAKKAGIEQQVHPHLLRHSAASYLLKKNMDIRKVQEVLRHAHISSTEIYTHVDKDDLKKEVEEMFG